VSGDKTSLSYAIHRCEEIKLYHKLYTDVRRYNIISIRYTQVSGDKTSLSYAIHRCVEIKLHYHTLYTGVRRYNLIIIRYTKV